MVNLILLFGFESILGILIYRITEITAAAISGIILLKNVKKSKKKKYIKANNNRNNVAFTHKGVAVGVPGCCFPHQSIFSSFKRYVLN